MESEDQEQDGGRAGALRDLLQSEGWHLLTAQADHEYGPSGYGRRMQEALSSVPQGPDRAYEIARVAEQVDATARALNSLIAWPTEELKRLTATQEKPSRWMSRQRVMR